MVVFETYRHRANMVKKKIELDMSGVISQMSQIKPLLTQLLIVQYFKINKECKQEIIIVLTKLDHLEIVF